MSVYYVCLYFYLVLKEWAKLSGHTFLDRYLVLKAQELISQTSCSSMGCVLHQPSGSGVAFLSHAFLITSMVTHTGLEAGGLRVQGHPQLSSESEARLGYRRPRHKGRLQGETERQVKSKLQIHLNLLLQKPITSWKYVRRGQLCSWAFPLTLGWAESSIRRSS